MQPSVFEIGKDIAARKELIESLSEEVFAMQAHVDELTQQMAPLKQTIHAKWREVMWEKIMVEKLEGDLQTSC